MLEITSLRATNFKIFADWHIYLALQHALLALQAYCKCFSHLLSSDHASVPFSNDDPSKGTELPLIQKTQ